MANQAIALQARAPQGGGLGTAIQQGAQMVNMMTQQRAAERQAAQAQQAMEIAAAQEARAAAKAVPEFQKAEAEAGKARVAYVMDFFDASELAIANVRDPQQARAVGTRLKQLFKEPEFHEAIDETLGSLPQDPSQFEAWREQALFLTMDAKDQLSREFQRQTTGEEERILSMPKYGTGPAIEVPGSRIKAAEGIQFIKLPDGSVVPQPKIMPGTGGFGTGGAAAVGGADTVYGFGQYGAPSKPLSSLTIGEVQDFQKGTLIPATRGKIGAGPDKGTGAVGTYQITYGTLQKYAPRVLGENWRSVPFTADVQDKIARAIYEDVKGGDLRQTWAGMPSNKPGAYANVPWEQVRSKIAAVESGGGGLKMGQPLTTGPTKEQRQVSKGQANVSKTVDTLRGLYAELRERGGAVESGGGILDTAGNIGNYIAGTPVGRPFGRALGTKEQATRDKIINVRRMLVTQIADAAGLSAQEMNSNVELQGLLDAATDPTQSIETVEATLNEIEKLYGLPGSTAKRIPRKTSRPAKGSSKTKTPTRSGIPKDIADKYGL